MSNSPESDYVIRDPDALLMLEVRNGDDAAFEELMRLYQSRLVIVLTHLSGNPDCAEDLAQDVFLRVYRARDSYVPKAKFSTWLFAIANNVAMNSLRLASRRREVKLKALESGQFGVTPFDDLLIASSGQIPTRRLDKIEMRRIVRVALDALNERQRTAIVLNKFESMSYDDIAQVMGLSRQAIKSLLSRARIALRDVLEPYMRSGKHPNSGKGS